MCHRLVASAGRDSEDNLAEQLGTCLSVTPHGLVHTCANDRKDNTPNSCGWTIRGMLIFCTMAYTPMGMPAAPQMHLKTNKRIQISHKNVELTMGSEHTLEIEKVLR